MIETMSTQFKSMLIVFYAIMFGHTAFALVAVFVLHAGAIEPMPELAYLVYVAAAVSIFAIAASYLIYRSKIKAALKLPTTEEKFAAWRIAYILKIALLEIPCILNIIFLIVSNNKLFLYLYILTAIIMLMSKPTKYKVQEELDIADEF